MLLRDALLEVSLKQYKHRDGKMQAAQQALWALAREPLESIPLGLKVLVSGSGQSLPVVPWIALIDPDVTRTATQGLYLVYLYSADLSNVFLSLNQGATQHLRLAEAEGLRGVKAEKKAIGELAWEASQVRSALETESEELPSPVIELGSSRFLPRAYEAGSMCAITYSLQSLPDNDALNADLFAMASLYARAVEVKDRLVAQDPTAVRTASREKGLRISAQAPPMFRPKSADDYRVAVKSHVQVRSRRHEDLVRRFGERLRERGLTPATNVHPRDLTVVDSAGVDWLVEAKTVGLSAEHAVRECIGQLLAYRHFLYSPDERERLALLALFSEPVGEAFAEFLRSLGIEYLAMREGDWEGSEPALRLIGWKG